MAFRIRTVASTVFLILMSTVSLFASSDPLRVMVQPASERVLAIRYQAGTMIKNMWTELNEPSPILLLEAFDSTQDHLYIQQSEDFSTWSAIYKYRYDPFSHTWEAVPSKVKKSNVVESLELTMHGLYPVGNCSTYYSYMLGAGLKINIIFNEQKNITGYAEVAYSRGPSKSDWVNSMQAVNMSVGMGYRYGLTDKLQITPELGYGLALHLLNADFNEDGVKNLETFIDQQVRFSLNLSYAFSETYHLIVAPLSILFFEKGAIGSLLGIQTGFRLNF